MIEIWKDIDEFKGLYQVSNKGRVRSLDRINIYKNGAKRFEKGRILAVSKNKLGYLQVGLHKLNKNYSRRVHRLVAQAFVENPLNYPEINHKDANKNNNYAENLEWCDRSMNMQHAVKMGLKPKHLKNRPNIEKWKKILQSV